jgi:type II secretory pathway component PulJ
MTAAHEGEEGTTLLELLVALSLLALLAVYAVSAIRYLQNFDRVQTLIEDRAAMEAVRTHLRRSIEAMRTAFLISDGSSPKLAFSGGKEAVSFVTHADSRLEYGGLYLVRFAITEDATGLRDLVTVRRAFRPRMDPAAPSSDSLPVLTRIESLSFSYFGSPQEGVRPEWFADWPEANVLPQAIRIKIGFTSGDQRLFAPLDVMVPVAK